MSRNRPPQVILTADDFGRSHDINRAILAAYRAGCLSSASLMIAGEAADEAIDMARHNPGLAVGLHLVLIDGPAALPAADIPHLVDSSGRFPARPLELGLRYCFQAVARHELALEIRAQFERFAATGLPLSHVDGHWHFHLHPSAWRIILPLLQEFHAAGVRLPRDDLWLALGCDRQRWAAKLAMAAVFSLLSRNAARGLRASPCAVPAASYGLFGSGAMGEAYVQKILERIDAATAEIYFHPTFGPRLDPLGPNRGDYQALTSGSLRSALRHGAIQLARYKGLRPLAWAQP